MTKREKILAAAVGLLGVVVAAFFGITRLSDTFSRKDSAISRLEDEVYEKERIVKLGHRASQQLSEFEKRSLPPEPSLARSLYQAWLLEAANKVALDSVNVSSLPGRPSGDVYYQHAFMLNAQGDLGQLTDFLHGFYSVGYLHRIARLSVKPLARSRQLDLTISIEALSLFKAPRSETLGQLPANRLVRQDLNAYIDKIGSRNLFGPANNPPRLMTVSTQRGNPNQPLVFRLRADDPDKSDQLTYSLDGDAPTGARIDARSGEFAWTPSELGEFPVVVRVTDNGLPAKSVVETVWISVVQAPPPPDPQPVRLGFDPATQAILTGITEAGGRRVIWISIRTEGRVLKLAEGDQIVVGSLQGTVRRIGISTAEIETSDGRRVTVGLGKRLLSSEGATLGGI